MIVRKSAPSRPTYWRGVKLVKSTDFECGFAEPFSDTRSARHRILVAIGIKDQACNQLFLSYLRFVILFRAYPEHTPSREAMGATRLVASRGQARAPAGSGPPSGAATLSALGAVQQTPP